MCTMIGQFSRLYLIVHPAKFKSLFELKSSLSMYMEEILFAPRKVEPSINFM